MTLSAASAKFSDLSGSGGIEPLMMLSGDAFSSLSEVQRTQRFGRGSFWALDIFAILCYA